MKRTGEILRKAREKKGLSINEIALSLKISSKILKSIEEGDTKHLPAKTFLRGFVQSYANYLRLDVNDVLQIFHDEMGTTKPAPLIQMPEQDETLEAFDKKDSENGHSPRAASSVSEKPFNSLANKNNNTRTIIFTFLGVLLVGLIIFTKKMIDKYQKEGAISEVEVIDPLATPPPEAPLEVSSEATTASNTAEISTPTPTPTPQATAMSTPLATPTPSLSSTQNGLVAATPTTTVTAPPTTTPIKNPTPTPTPTPISTPAPTPTPSPSPSPTASPSPSPSTKPVEVIIEALDNVEIEYGAPNGKIEKMNLMAEQVHTFKSKTGLRLNINNGGAVNVIVNGKDLGIPGNLGKPVKLNF